MLIKKTKFSLNTLFYSIIVMAGVAQAASQPITDYGNTPQLWRQKLTQLNNGDDVVFRVLQLGDSHTAGAFFTDELRNRLQQRWGNAGIGWVFPQQISGQRNTQIRYQGTWKTLTSRKERADFPLGGVLARSQKADILTLHSNQAQGKQRITFAMRPILANGALTVRGAEGEHTPAYGLHGNVWQYFSLDATFPLQFQAQDNELWELGAINIENGH